MPIEINGLVQHKALLTAFEPLANELGEDPEQLLVECFSQATKVASKLAKNVELQDELRQVALIDLYNKVIAKKIILADAGPGVVSLFYTVALNSIIDELRRRARRREDSGDMDSSPSSASAAASSQSEAREAFERCLPRLSPDNRVIIEGMLVERDRGEVCKEIGCERSEYYERRKKAFAQFRRFM